MRHPSTTLASDAGRRCHVLERAVPAIAIKRVAARVTDEDVDPPVPVEVADRDRAPVPGVLETGRSRRQLERPVASIEKESIRRSLFGPVRRGMANLVEIEIAVLIGIENGEPPR